MNPLGLILATAVLLFACSTVSSRSIDVPSENEESSLDLLNIPAELEFESGAGDELEGSSRDKRTPRMIFRTVSCLFTFLVNPSCLQGITGGGNGGGGGLAGLFGGSGSSSSSSSSYGSNRRQQSSSQPYYMISLPRYNDSDSNSTSATEYPIYPIESTSEYPEEQPSRPTNPILAMIQWKLNLIPNMIRRFIPGFGGGRRDEGNSNNGFNFMNLGGGRGLAGLFGGARNNGGGGGFGGFNLGNLNLGGGLGGGFGGGQY